MDPIKVSLVVLMIVDAQALLVVMTLIFVEWFQERRSVR